MKVVITHLKAPWPAGAAVGDIIELVGFHGELPGWAEGKCTPAADDAEASQVLERVAPAILEAPPKPAAVLLAEAEAKLAALSAELAEAQATIAKLQGPSEEQAAIEAQAAAEKAEAEQKAAHTAKLQAAGVKVDGRWSVARLAEEVAKLG